jgi:hypothetical protein
VLNIEARIEQRTGGGHSECTGSASEVAVAHGPKRIGKKADAALTTGAFGSQPRHKLGLLGGELLRRENALLLQFG